MDCSLPDSSVHGISQARILEGGCHFLLQGDLPDPGMELASSAWQGDSLPLSHLGSPSETGLSTKEEVRPYPSYFSWGPLWPLPVTCVGRGLDLAFLSVVGSHGRVLGFPGVSDGKEFACNFGDQGSIPGF